MESVSCIGVYYYSTQSFQTSKSLFLALS